MPLLHVIMNDVPSTKTFPVISLEHAINAFNSTKEDWNNQQKLLNQSLHDFKATYVDSKGNKLDWEEFRENLQIESELDIIDGKGSNLECYRCTQDLEGIHIPNDKLVQELCTKNYTNYKLKMIKEDGTLLCSVTGNMNKVILVPDNLATVNLSTEDNSLTLNKVVKALKVKDLYYLVHMDESYTILKLN